jgi:hypothetical protein
MNRGMFCTIWIQFKRFSAKHHICCEKNSNTKSVEASAFVLSKMYFSQHMNRGKCFALFEFNIRGLVQNI